jgi:tRNA(fMet)-specific endonuclease VapC
MAGRHLLDTSVIVELIGGDQAIEQCLVRSDETFVPSIVLGELYVGARRSLRVDENLRQIEAFAAGSRILPCDADTARHYGLIKNLLRIKGRPIPDNDIWIAAIARQYGLTLVTRDTHFGEITDLPVERW